MTTSFIGSGSSTFSGSGSALSGVVPAVSLRRIGAGEFYVGVPVLNAPPTKSALWRLKTNPTGTWSIQGCYGVDLTGQATAVQLSDSGNTSVWEYARLVGIADASHPPGFDYAGNGHVHESLLTLSMLLDGVNVSTLAVGATAFGQSLVIYQTTTMYLPKRADGTSDGDATVCGSSTLRHTFSSGLLVEHTHVMLAGFQGFSTYAAMCPTHFANMDRIQLGDLPVRTPTGSGLTVDYGTQAAVYSAWGTGHNFKLTMTLPSGGPLVPSDWSKAGPDRMWFFDRPDYGKCYVDDWGAAPPRGNGDPARIPLELGSTSHAQRYEVSWR